VLAYRVKVSGPIADGETTGQITYFVVDKATHAVLGRFVLPNASHTMRAFRLLVEVTALADAYDVGVFDEASRFVSSGYDLEAPPAGAVGAAA
jgi:hypothetical protein